MFNIHIDGAPLEKLAAEVVATEKQFEKALRSTLGKMAKWTKTRSIRGLAEELKFPQRVLRRRIKVLKGKNGPLGPTVQVFYGENPVGMIYLSPRQTSTGVTAAGREVKGAFIATMKSGHKEVFKRDGSGRLPITEQAVEMKTEADRYIDKTLVESAEFSTQFFKVFEHELQWQTRS